MNKKIQREKCGTRTRSEENCHCLRSRYRRRSRSTRHKIPLSCRQAVESLFVELRGGIESQSPLGSRPPPCSCKKDAPHGLKGPRKRLRNCTRPSNPSHPQCILHAMCCQCSVSFIPNTRQVVPLHSAFVANCVLVNLEVLRAGTSPG